MGGYRVPTVLLIAGLFLLAGCSSGGLAHFVGTQSNSAPVSLAVTGTLTGAPISGLSILSFQVAVTSAELEPGNVQLIASSQTVEVTRLQTETALLTSAAVSVSPGSYTGMMLTFSNPSLTFRNDSGATVTVGGTACLTGNVCNLSSPALTNLTSALSFTGGSVALSANTPAALLLNLNLSNLLTTSQTLPNTIVANATASGAVTVSQLTPAQQGAPFTSIEDAAGTITAKDTVHNTFTLQTPLGSYTVVTNTGASGTAYANFPNTCTSPSFACIAAGEIVSVDMNLLPEDLNSQPNTTLLATQVFFEDADSTKPEVEGIVVATSGSSVTAPAQFNIVVLQNTPPVGVGYPVGSVVGVELGTTPPATFDVDQLIGAANASVYSAYSFAAATIAQDLIVGQEVQIQLLSGSTNSLAMAGRVRLRSSRFTANVITTASNSITVGTLPAFFGSAGISQVLVTTSVPPTPNAFTELIGAASISQIGAGKSVSVRGQLFARGTTPVAVATKVIQH